MKKNRRSVVESSLQSSRCSDPLPSLASYLDRFKAQVVDMFMLYTPILYGLTYLLLGGAQAFRSSPWAPFVAVFLYAILHAIFLSRTGQTPGCKAYRLRVVDCQGRLLGFPLALVRFFLFLLSATLLFGVILPAIRRKKSTLHDWILKTSVVYDSGSAM